jgi:hypothetical protein
MIAHVLPHSESQASAATAVNAGIATAQLLKAAAYQMCGAPAHALIPILALMAAPSGSAEERCLAFAQLVVHAAEHRSYTAAARVRHSPCLMPAGSLCYLSVAAPEYHRAGNAVCVTRH